MKLIAPAAAGVNCMTDAKLPMTALFAMEPPSLLDDKTDGGRTRLNVVVEVEVTGSLGLLILETLLVPLLALVALETFGTATRASAIRTEDES